MTLSLRARLLLFVALINTAVFGLGFLALSRLLQRDRFEQGHEAMQDLLSTLPPSLDLGGEQFVPQLLRWSRWGRFQDAILVHARIERSSNGELQPRGVFLNLLGKRVRRPAFDQQALLGAVQDSIASRTSRPVLGGLVLPVLDARGQVWGACWYVPKDPDTHALLGSLLALFALSTLLLIVVTFAALRRFVLEPVEKLAHGARELSRGAFSTRLALPQRRDEFSELIRGFNQMAETVEGFNARLAREVEVATENARRAEQVAMTQRRLAATGELAAGIAHEINNPLGGLLNATETLARPDLAPEKRGQYVELVKQGLERIRRTVGQLLRFTPRAPNTVALDLVDPVLDAIGLVGYRARSSGVRLELCGVDALGPGREAVAERLRSLPRVRGDQPELAQAVLNLLVNALDALESPAAGSGPGSSRPGARIAIDLRAVDGSLLLVVEDNGPGIPPELLPRVSDLFFTTKEVGKGSGLGLSIVHNVAAAHAATLHLSAASGGGLRVELTFPLVADARGGGAA